MLNVMGAIMAATDEDKPDTIPEHQVDTKRIDTEQFNPELRAQLKQLSNTYHTTSNELALYFPSYSDPFRIEVDDYITIGRADPETKTYPSLDLGPYYASQLGVSRYHAEIRLISGRFHIKDMGSRNGTRVNGVKIMPFTLVPFTKGDEIRLGHFAMIIA
jgi:pSer/pThr/pTyr-binding forkhead associated (FHA) protein